MPFSPAPRHPHTPPPPAFPLSVTRRAGQGSVGAVREIVCEERWPHWGQRVSQSAVPAALPRKPTASHSERAKAKAWPITAALATTAMGTPPVAPTAAGPADGAQGPADDVPRLHAATVALAISLHGPGVPRVLTQRSM